MSCYSLIKMNPCSLNAEFNVETSPSDIQTNSRLLYTVNKLRTLFHNNQPTISVVNTLKFYSIYKRPYKRTRRGTKGGRLKNSPVTVNQANLITVNIKNDRARYRHSSLNFATQNARSVRNKTIVISNMITERDIDFLIVTESWLLDEDEHIVNEIVPEGYSYLFKNRSSGQSGGGLLVIFKSGLKVQKVENVYNFKHFEHIELVVTHNNFSYRVIGLYRAPPSAANGNSVPGFFNEFEHFLIDKTTESAKLLILGDFNFHIDDMNDKYAERFLELINSFNLKQHVTEATHRDGHILDVVINHKNDNSILNIQQFEHGISDHQLISVNIENTKPRPQKKTIVYKKTKNVDLDKFKQDIKSRLGHAVSEARNVVEKVDIYNSVLKNIFDSHAPDRTKTITIRENNGTWYTDEIRSLKRDVRKLEKTWRRAKTKNLKERTENQNDANRIMEHNLKRQYIEARKHLNQIIVKSKNKSIRESIIDNKHNTKELFKIVDKHISSGKQTSKLPDYNMAEELASNFNVYFESKISKIRQDLDVVQENVDYSGKSHSLSNSSKCKFDNFSAVTIQDIQDIILKLPNKTCDLDPLPTWLLKECYQELAPIITDIINSSLATSTVPESLKRAVVKPLLKKPSLDRNQYKHFRPVSNLCTLSKILEKIVSFKLNNYLDKSGFRSMVQSAYRKGHCTESALIRVHNDLINYVAEKKTGILVLLDLSAAFDTIDQDLLLNRLRTDFDIDGIVLDWFRSYLSDRTQCVAIEKALSSSSSLRFGVPQGSVLGPLLFTLYTTPISSIISSYDLNFHLFADDTQIYFPVTNDTKDSIIPRVEACVKDVKHWMVRNKLKLNEEKTEIISFCGNNRKKTDIESMDIAGSQIKVLNAGNVRNLGVYLDSRLTMDSHVTKTVQNCQFHLKRIYRIRHLLDEETSKILMSSLILSRIDYCNALLQSSPKYALDKLQKVQNRAARMVVRCGVRDHVTPVLRYLHWLPVTFRIQFKILCYAFKCYNKIGPEYLNELVTHHMPQRTLRSKNLDLLYVPRRKSVIGDRAFSLSAPVLWNQTPTFVKRNDTHLKFKKCLKTHLFNKAFN